MFPPLVLSQTNPEISSLLLLYNANSKTLLTFGRRLQSQDGLDFAKTLLCKNTQILDTVFSIYCAAEPHCEEELAIIENIRIDLRKIADEIEVFRFKLISV
jgi:hypothetical protein